ncbi:MAG: tRNA (adenosine(37)-N6)-threonylcarbamoyltransferase complex transferase subunit TsaD [Parcubacteria group bacterium]|jgi:N6-L-threonylcarbamoyladenine synthase
MIILGLETSCDETAASVLEVENEHVTVLSSVISSQIALHATWGGVVPNLAAREHLKNILPVIGTTLEKAGKKPAEIDLMAVTKGPGLIPALLIGTTTAKTLAYLWRVPLIGIHHIEGHIYANFISTKNNTLKFPILALVVSGGHTQLVLMKKHLDYEIIGETVDDAVGEAFDKVARILGLGYPGGPAVANLADKFTGEKKFKITLPRPMLKSANFNFSFSGLKTAVLYATKKNPENFKDQDYISEMCHEFQSAVTDVLIAKTIRAAKKYVPKTILLAGGVSANTALREKLTATTEKDLKNTICLVPEFAYSLDNAAMIAMAGYYRWKNLKDKKSLEKTWQDMQTSASLKM